MKVIPFGTNGFFPSFGRHTACYVIPVEDKLFVLDAGSGLFRFAEKQGSDLLKNTTEIHLLLSHYHLDHTFGFYGAFKLFENKKVVVYSYSDRQVFREMTNLKYFPIDFDKKHHNFYWKKIFSKKTIGKKITIFSKKQDHRGETSLAYRIKIRTKKEVKNLSYVTDGKPSRKIIEFVRGSNLLLVEHSESGKELREKKGDSFTRQILDGHITTIGASLIAKQARVDKMALIHHKPFHSKEFLKKQLKLAKSIFPKSILACDLQTIQF